MIEEEVSEQGVTAMAAEKVDKTSNAAVDSATTTEVDAEYKLPQSGCCSWIHFNGLDMAKGYNIIGIAQGALVMSNVFLSIALIHYASEQAGCLDEEGIVIEDCTTKVYGFRPATLISNVAFISGLLSAFLMPVIGAMLDFTPHRKLVATVAALMLTLIHAIQIGTTGSTWFAMAILQAIAGFFYQVEVMSMFAYLPDIARVVGEKTMTRYTATFVMTGFGSHALYTLVIIVLSMAFSLDDVATSQLSQAIIAVWVGIAFYFGLKYLPNAPANHKLPEGHGLLIQGLVQTFSTTRLIWKHYSKGLRWFLLAIAFTEAAANALTILAVVYLSSELKMSGSEIGIFFLLTLIGTLPGSVLGAFITGKTNPSVSLRLCICSLMVTNIVGVLLLQEGMSVLAYVWGTCIGVSLGWLYPTENLFFSMCLPKGQEAELAGFYVYCTQILGWLPQLLFSILVENDVSQKVGIISVCSFFAIGIALLSCAAPWKVILVEVAKPVEEALKEETKSQNESNA